MRPGPEFPMVHGAPTAAPHALNGTVPHSAWQSPVPYLFGGLAAMLGLIAFALLILACSYWKLSGYLDNGSGSDGQAGSSAAEADGEKGSTSGTARPAMGFQEHVVVIMAGDERPTFLAMPAMGRAAGVELGAVPGVSGHGGEGAECSGDQEKKLAEEQQGCEVSSQPQPQVGGEADAASRSQESTSSSSTTLQESSQ